MQELGYKQTLYYQDVTENIVIASLYQFKSDIIVQKYYETVNMGCIALPDELIFIDCGVFPKLAKNFRKDMEKRFNQKTKYLMLTDVAWDHSYGMEAFSDVDTIITSLGKSFFSKNIKNKYVDTIKEHVIKYYTEDESLRESLLNSTLNVPSIGVNITREFGPDSNKIIFKPTKTRSAVIYSTNDKTLFTGDVLMSFFPTYSWSIEIVDLYKEWEQLDIQFIVTGHGPVIEKAYITELRQYCEKLLTELRELKNQGLTIKQVLKQNLPEYPELYQQEWIKGTQHVTGRLESFDSMIKAWYNQILKEPEEEDLMFVS
ncbi:MAG: hypothetical protein ACXAC7_05905 [Candidatus Hodarchaeales archaeon]|jgi:glyoxylase-like metal-dependent hydrolase (beta-lactamase superfamily II)